MRPFLFSGPTTKPTGFPENSNRRLEGVLLGVRNALATLRDGLPAVGRTLSGLSRPTAEASGARSGGRRASRCNLSPWEGLYGRPCLKAYYSKSELL